MVGNIDILREYLESKDVFLFAQKSKANRNGKWFQAAIQ